MRDILQDFKMVCMNFPFKIGGKIKELPKRDWADGDGEDTYIPKELPLEAYDLEIEVCYKGDLNNAYDRILFFRDYLTGKDGGGAELKIYNSHTGIGRKGIFLLDMGDFEFAKSNMDEVVKFKMKLRVTDPKTQIVPVYGTDKTKVVKLIEK